MSADKKKKSASGGRSKKTNAVKAPSAERWLRPAPERRGMIAVLAAALVVLILVGVASSTGFFDTKRVEAASALRIEEVMASNGGALVTDDGAVPDWVRVKNTGSEKIDLRHCGLMLREDPTDIYCFPAIQLGSGESITVLASNSPTSGKDGLEAPFALNASGGETLVLFDASGKLIDSVLLPEMNLNDCYRRTGDEWSLVTAAMSAGISVTAGELELSEVMYSNTLYYPDTDGSCYDYAEIQNISSSNVNLEGWALSDSAEKLSRWTFPAVTLAPGGRITVHCSGKDNKNDPGHLHTDFSLTAGETLYLTRPDGKTVSAVTLPALENDANIAYSFADGEWTTRLAPTPNMPNDNDGAQSVREGLFGSRLYINEIIASATEQECDWMEIYNGTGETVNLGGCGLSDDASKPRKWQFPDGMHIAPGEYLVVCCSPLTEATIGGYQNTGFALGLDGGYTVSLSDPDGKVMDAFYVPQQYGGVGYGRADGQRGLYFFEKSTPGASNGSSGYIGKAPKAVPDIAGGLHKSGESFSVTLTAPAGARIFYTTDCTDPTNSSTPYTSPIPVSGTTILRTRVFMDGYLPSSTATQSYLYDVQTQENVYTISLVSDPDNLVSNERGIMVRGSGEKANYAQDWEREAHFELFTDSGEKVIGQGVDIGLHGMGTRKSPVKSFNIKASGAYGSSRLYYPIFRERDYQDYSSIMLRPSGEDYEMSFMRDSLLSSLMKDTNLLYQKWELGVCYLNGQYYSLYYIRERITPDSICQFHNWTGLKDSVSVLVGNDTVRHGSASDFKEVLSTLKSMDMSTQAAYEYLDEHIDIENYINYMCIELFSGNTDTLNRRFYRNTKADGKWRWALYDLDWAFFTDYDSMGKWLTPGGAGVRNMTDNSLFIASMKNPTFRDRFLTRFGELLAGPFRTQNVLDRIDERAEILKDLLPDFMATWNISEKTLTRGVNKLREYAQERPAKIIGYTRDALKLDDGDMQKYFGAAIQEIQKAA